MALFRAGNLENAARITRRALRDNATGRSSRVASCSFSLLLLLSFPRSLSTGRARGHILAIPTCCASEPPMCAYVRRRLHTAVGGGRRGKGYSPGTGANDRARLEIISLFLRNDRPMTRSIDVTVDLCGSSIDSPRRAARAPGAREGGRNSLSWREA